MGPRLGRLDLRRQAEQGRLVAEAGRELHPEGQALLAEYPLVMPFQNISEDEARAIVEYLRTVEVDFVSPHRPREPKSPGQTAETTRQLLLWMKQVQREVPVHYQEPFRRGFSSRWEPTAEDFATDLDQAIQGGAAGWCFHNGDRRGHPDGTPRRSFDLSGHGLWEQLDLEELAFVDRKLAEVKRF